MAWIKQIAPAEATGRLKRIYDRAKSRGGRVFGIVRVQSQNPETLEASMGLYMATMHAKSPVPRSLREMIATVVSRANNCHY